MIQSINFKNNRGITGIDLAVAMIVIVLFVSLIFALFYNVYISTVGVRRNEQAISYAVAILETIEQYDYEDVTTEEEPEDIFINDLQAVVDNINKDTAPEIENRKTRIVRENTNIETFTNPYIITIDVTRYEKEDHTETLDIVKTITLNTYYRIGKKEEKEKVEIKTLKTVNPAYTDSVGIQPKLLDSEAMIPVKYVYTNEATGEGNWYVTTVTDSEWFDYSKKQWANVMIGPIFDPENGRVTAIGDMFVYIPRYAYKIAEGSYHTDTAGAIDIKFLSRGNSCKDGTKIDIKTQASEGVNAGTDYMLHPAFRFGDTNLSGIWVAKFEASANGIDVQSLPSQTSWTNIDVAEMFARSGEFAGNKSLDSNLVDSHMMKNIEWGAAAYLAHSKYGRNGTEIGVNTSVPYTTGGGINGAYKTNVNQSTTGNIYGIYDMSGGAAEYVMGILKGTDFYLGASGFIEQDLQDQEKYYDLYQEANDVSQSDDGMEENFKQNQYKIGDAIYETSSDYPVPDGGSSYWQTSTIAWFADMTRYYTSFTPYLIRGCIDTGNSWPGLFCYYAHPGNAESSVGFRIVLTAK